MKIENYQVPMQSEIDSLILEAFTKSDHGYGGEVELTNSLRQGSTTTFELVANNNSKIVGDALLSEAKINNTVGLVLAPLSVLVSVQHQGVGSTLMNAIEDVATKNDYAFISILGHPGFYTKFGYKPAKEFNVSAPMDVPDEAFMIKIFNKNTDLTGTLQYAPEFGI